MQWNDKYCIDIEEVDEQHKELFRKANLFIFSVKHGNGDKHIGQMLKNLVEYTKIHFTDEEEIMKMYNYPELKKHKILHHELVEDIVKVLKRIKSGQKYSSIELIRFLEDWLTHHITEEDIKIGKFLKSSNKYLENGNS